MAPTLSLVAYIFVPRSMRSPGPMGTAWATVIRKGTTLKTKFQGSAKYINMALWPPLKGEPLVNDEYGPTPEEVLVTREKLRLSGILT